MTTPPRPPCAQCARPATCRQFSPAQIASGRLLLVADGEGRCHAHAQGTYRMVSAPETLANTAQGPSAPDAVGRVDIIR